MQVLLHRLQAVVTSESTTNLQFRRADLEVELVVNHEQVPNIVNAISFYELANAPSGIVHERLREGNDDQLRVDSKFGDARRLFRRFQVRAVARREQFDDFGADIVASAVVLIARVPETNDEKVGGCSRAIRRLTAKHCEIFASTGDAKW